MNELSTVTLNGDIAIAELPAPDELRAFLRAHTRESHSRLAAHFASLGSHPTIEDYHRFILMNLVAYRALSSFLAWPGAAAASMSTLIDDNRCRLEADTAQMHLDCRASIEFAIEPYGRAEAFGLAYVLNGSRLGGRFIHRRLQKAGLFEAGLAESFLTATFERDETAPAAFDPTIGSGEGYDRRALEAATATFDLFERALDCVMRTRGAKGPMR